MAFISDIEGLKGENLASAMLAHLLIRSEAVRRSFVKQVSALSQTGPIIVEQQFAVFTEVVTDKNKRLDLLIQTDDAVIGIENKFGAEFQHDQPKDYVDLVAKKAKKLEEAWGYGFQPMLIVLAPERREKKTLKRIKDQEIERSCVFMSWESLMTAVDRNSLPELPPVERFLVDELAGHVKMQTGAIDLDRLVKHINNPWQARGSAVVRQFYDQIIWPLIDETYTDATTYGGAETYYGYRLSKGASSRPWIGFVDANHVSGSDSNGAEFVVGFPIEAAAKALCKATKAREVILGDGWDVNRHCVAVHYDTDWVSRDKWETMMTAVNGALKIAAD